MLQLCSLTRRNLWLLQGLQMYEWPMMRGVGLFNFIAESCEVNRLIATDLWPAAFWEKNMYLDPQSFRSNFTRLDFNFAIESLEFLSQFEISGWDIKPKTFTETATYHQWFLFLFIISLFCCPIPFWSDEFLYTVHLSMQLTWRLCTSGFLIPSERLKFTLYWKAACSLMRTTWTTQRNISR